MHAGLEFVTCADGNDNMIRLYFPAPMQSSYIERYQYHDHHISDPTSNLI